MVRHSILLLLLALSLGGCASRGAGPETHLAAPACDTHWNLSAARSLDADDSLLQQQRFDTHSACRVNADGVLLRYALFRLPPQGGETRLIVSSLIQGRSLFAPVVALLDEQGQVLRQWEFDRFSMRGDQLQLDLYLGDAASAERYLLVHSAPQAVGQQRERVVSGSFVLPILTGVVPMLFMHGTERETQYTLSHDGQVEIRVDSDRSPRRNLPAQQMLRAELGAF